MGVMVAKLSLFSSTMSPLPVAVAVPVLRGKLFFLFFFFPSVGFCGTAAISPAGTVTEFPFTPLIASVFEPPLFGTCGFGFDFDLGDLAGTEVLLEDCFGCCFCCFRCGMASFVLTAKAIPSGAAVAGADILAGFRQIDSVNDERRRAG